MSPAERQHLILRLREQAARFFEMWVNTSEICLLRASWLDADAAKALEEAAE